MEQPESPNRVRSSEIVRHPLPDKTAEQHLKGIFLHLQRAERLPEPERTKQLKRMIAVALDDLHWVKMPNAKLTDAGTKDHEST
jgi:hypothetical protein